MNHQNSVFTYPDGHVHVAKLYLFVQVHTVARIHMTHFMGMWRWLSRNRISKQTLYPCFVSDSVNN